MLCPEQARKHPTVLEKLKFLKVKSIVLNHPSSKSIASGVIDWPQLSKLTFSTKKFLHWKKAIAHVLVFSYLIFLYILPNGKSISYIDNADISVKSLSWNVILQYLEPTGIFVALYWKPLIDLMYLY